MGIVSLVHINFDLLLVGVAIAGTVLLGSIIFFNNTKSITNRTFLFFSILTAIWGVSNYLEYRFTTIDATLWALRLHLFVSTLHAFSFFQLAYVFPRERVEFARWYKFFLIPAVVTTMIVVLTPFVFSGIAALAPVGQVTRGTPGPGIVLFILIAFGLLISSLIILFRRVRGEVGSQRRQSLMLFIGMSLMATLILIFNVILPNVFSDRSFIPLAALFIFPFVAFTSYAIHRHHLFDLKVATTAFSGFMITVFTFINVLYSTQAIEIIINVTAFAIVLLGSIKIVQDTLGLKNLTDELQESNERQRVLMHFVGHEVKGFLAKDEGAFAALSDGDFGVLPETLKPFVDQALKQSRDGARSVTDILKASNLKKGTVAYTKESFDLGALVAEAIEKIRSTAERKGLTLSFSTDEASMPYMFVGDKSEIGDHVLRNLIDNAINYTPSGSINISLKKENGKIVFSVKDSGIGITEEDKKHLFTEGGHGKDSQRVNAHSTGYGLYIAKNIIVAHGGTIRAESEGAGRGSTFTIELPV
jgi:signal transduction histidine kinase